jgi:hypothetical protein
MTDGANQDLGHPVSRQRRGTWSYEEGEGAAFDRVAYFTDAVFAIAMTLLIVSVEAPELAGPQDDPDSLLDPLYDLGPQLFSFFIAFLLLGRYWMTHHAFFAALRRVDRRFIGLNLCIWPSWRSFRSRPSSSASTSATRSASPSSRSRWR